MIPTPPSRRRRSARRDQGPPAPPPPPPVAASPPLAAPAAPPLKAPAAEPPGPDQDGPARLRRRPRRPGAPADSARESAREFALPPPGDADEPVAPNPPGPPPVRVPRDRRVDATERALRNLVTNRGTQVSWSAATRARSVSAPTAADLAEAERDVVIVRRHYTPPEPLSAGRRGNVPRRPRASDPGAQEG